MNARDDGMQHSAFLWQLLGLDSNAISLVLIFFSFHTVNRKKSTSVNLDTAIICTIFHICHALVYICYLNTELLICDALHLGLLECGGGKEIAEMVCEM